MKIIFERGRLSAQTESFFHGTLRHVLKEALHPESQFLDAKKTLKWINEKKYFQNENSAAENENFPLILKQMISENDPLKETPKPEFSLGISAFGACIWYLNQCLIDQDLISMKNFVHYSPSNDLISDQNQDHLDEKWYRDRQMVKKIFCY